ncbi:MAG: alpha/beta fold hydrolase [Betaproteobacteria bacterium]|nr:alpha/beta fold hydrolase [Betaproteobacteria bacterium]
MTGHPPLQPDWIDRPHQTWSPGDLRLESGEVVRDFALSYVVHGEVAPGAANVVLALSAISSTHHRLDFLIGAGRALDPARCAVIAIDAIGNGLTTSPSNSLAQPGMAFPRFTIRDMVESQRALLDHLGVGQLQAVIGASMGGMQALQWGVSHPRRMRGIVAMTPMASTAPWAAAINETSRRALMAAPDWQSGGARAWSAWVPLMQLLSGRTPAQLDSEFASAEAVHAWIVRRTDWWAAQGFAPVDWIYQSRAYDAHDVGTSPGFAGDTAGALASIQARTLVLAPALDLYNPAASAQWAAARIPGARMLEIPSIWGHQSASTADPAAGPWLNREIGAFLGNGVDG